MLLLDFEHIINKTADFMHILYYNELKNCYSEEKI